MIGTTYKTNEGYIVEIIEYFSSKNCSIKFENGFIINDVDFCNVRNGGIKNPYHRAVKNVGFIGQGKFKGTTDYKKSLSYQRWVKVIERGHCPKFKAKHPTYKDVTVCEEWHNFQNFAAWFEENYNPEYMQDWDLDKDIICKDCKIYSPETCAFVPKEINSLFKKEEIGRKSKISTGVRLTKSQKYSAYMSKNNKQIRLGTFNTPEEAIDAYKTAKERHVKEIADRWKDLIDLRLYNAMYEYNV